MQQKGIFDKIKPFMIGSLSGMTATTVIQPIDTVKVLIQLKKQDAGKGTIESPLQIAKNVINEKGIGGLYQGLDAALLRQLVYTGIRLGLYKVLQERVLVNQKRSLTFFQKAGYSLLTGLLGSFIANPVDLSLVRIQADNNLPKQNRRNYGNVFNALITTIREEGVLTLWRGSTPTMARAASVNCSQLVTYNSFKEFLMNALAQKKETIGIRLFSSAMSWIAIAFFSLPFDNVKTKLMSMKTNSAGQLPYKGFLDCFKKSIINEGVFGLWVGLSTFNIRVGPHAMITVLAQDFLHDLFTRKKQNQ